MTVGSQLPNFCIPNNLSLNADNYVQMIDGFLDRHKHSADKLDKTDIEYVLLYSMVETFPCTEK